MVYFTALYMSFTFYYFTNCCGHATAAVRRLHHPPHTCSGPEQVGTPHVPEENNGVSHNDFLVHCSSGATSAMMGEFPHPPWHPQAPPCQLLPSYVHIYTIFTSPSLPWSIYLFTFLGFKSLKLMLYINLIRSSKTSAPYFGSFYSF